MYSKVRLSQDVRHNGREIEMLPNKSEKILYKFIQVILFALLASALSAFYISQSHAADVTPDEIQMPST